MLRTIIFRQSGVIKSNGCAACSLMETRAMSSGTTDRHPGACTTVDTSDVQLHSKMKDDWWKLNGPMKVLHAMNGIRVPFIRDGLLTNCPENIGSKNPLKGMKVLDVGCGGGILSEALAILGAEVTGIDPSKDLISLAREHSCENLKLGFNLPKYICTTPEEHAPKHKLLYDGVVASEVIEHVHNKDLFIKCCTDVLKPGGRIFFTTPARTPLSKFCGIFMAENVLRMLPRGTHRYDMFITPPELTFLLTRTGNCNVEIVHGAFYNIITNHWSFTASQSLLYLLQACKLCY